MVGRGIRARTEALMRQFVHACTLRARTVIAGGPGGAVVLFKKKRMILGFQPASEASARAARRSLAKGDGTGARSGRSCRPRAPAGEGRRRDGCGCLYLQGWACVDAAPWQLQASPQHMCSLIRPAAACRGRVAFDHFDVTARALGAAGRPGLM
jgi:hypothetical protein